MPTIPEEPKTGQTPPKGWDHAMWAFARSLAPHGDDRFIRVSHDKCVNIALNFEALLKHIPIAAANAAASAAYNGYFKVINVDASHVRFVNGADPTNAKCGIVQVGSQNIELDAATLAISGAGHAYIRVWHDGSVYQAALAVATNVPSVAQEAYIDAATYTAAAAPSQIWTDGTINLNGDYWT